MPLELKKLSKRTGNRWILRDIDLTATDGRVFGICGRTGSGKTTLLNVIAGLGKANGGTVLLDGQELSPVKAKDRGILLLGGRETPGILSVFGGSQKDSTGEQQLQAFANAIANAPKVLLLDDPFVQMDRELRDACFQKVRAAAMGRIVIFASSYFDQLAAVAEEMAVIDESYVIQTGTPQFIYENPETVAAATLSGDNNLFEARRLTSTDADLPEFQTIEGSHRMFAKIVPKSRLGAINKNTTLAIRPEQVSMSMGASFPEDNLVRAVVTGINFCGATCLIEFDAGGLKLKARVFKVVGLTPGDECMLGLPPHRITILKD